ncbi:KinB-signaling pathway activation protein [Thermolongibacillus altinsuensis]|uniref:KinB-signaling pathway activation protein n=1 Tax=Thermolongibacillus altinsuensis TaxID=575256 RepID=UPI00242A2FDB|nr:KinB-signaling pathway activation protein [Thermolongibacillus altinsuensis]GMB10039.1 KinB-signaling pathway activation protein [Thermolongibacillus altinsuensis]
MNSRKWVKLFLSTLVVGGISTGIVGFAIKWNEYKHLFASFDVKEIISVLIWLIGVGFIFSVISQMGFFAYLTIHRFGLGIFRSVPLWNSVQLVLIAFVLFDLVYFRYQLFAEEGESLFSYIGIAVFIFIFGLIVAYIKMKQTNKEAFVPALFFMTVVTIIEWFPVLRINEESWLYLMLFPLLICNAYQLLILHKLIGTK